MSRGLRHNGATVNVTIVGPIPTQEFSFPRSGNEAMRGIEFRHSIRNASRIRRKWEM